MVLCSFFYILKRFEGTTVCLQQEQIVGISIKKRLLLGQQSFLYGGKAVLFAAAI